MGRRRAQDSPLVAALHATIGDLSTARYLADHIHANDMDAVTADPRAWVATGRVVLWVGCTQHTTDRYAIPDQFHDHQIVLDTNGIHLLDHPDAHDLAAEAFLTACGATTPTCVLLASATTQGGVLHPEHARAVTSMARSRYETLRYLVAARAFLDSDPDTDLAALRQVITQGLTPSHWQPWADAGFTPATAAPFLSREVPLTSASTWKDAGLATGRGATLAALGATPDEVTALIPALGKRAAHDWVQHTRTPVLPASDRIALHAAGFTPQAAASATEAVGVDGALAFAKVGLTDTSYGHRFNEYWWQVLPENPDAAAEWDTLGISSGYADHLIAKRAAAFEDGEEPYPHPDTMADWVHAGIRSIDELAPLAELTYCPVEWPQNTPRVICPDGIPLAWDDAIQLARTVDHPAAWIATAKTAPEWATTWAGPCCLVPSCTVPGCTDPVGPGHGDTTDGRPAIDTFEDDTHPFFNRKRTALITAICDAATEGFPEEALPALARHAHHGVRAWECAADLASMNLDTAALIAFLDSESPDALTYPGSRLRALDYIPGRAA